MPKPIFFAAFLIIFGTSAFGAKDTQVPCSLWLAEPRLAFALEDYQFTLSGAPVVLIQGNAIEIQSLAKKLVQAQSKVLIEKNIDHVMSDTGEWIDILPNQNGSALNQLAYDYANRTHLHSLLRYEPKMLFTDAYVGFDHLFYQMHDRSVLYLTHQDLNGLPTSELFKSQKDLLDLFEVVAKKTQHEDGLGSIFGNLPISAIDHQTDYAVMPRTLGVWANTDEANAAIIKYLKTSKNLEIIHNTEDPIQIRYGAEAQVHRLPGGKSPEDLRGWMVSEEWSKKGDVAFTTISGDFKNADEAAFDVFIANSARQFSVKNDYNRAVELPSGRTFFQLSGQRENGSAFTAYLEFLRGIYTKAPDLLISNDAFDRLKWITLQLRTRAELFLWADTPAFSNGPLAKDVDGGMILVRSEDQSELLPIEVLHPGLKVFPNRGESEVIIEMGRLGSLTPGETINFLKVAGVSLYHRYIHKARVRIICEADETRAAIFSKYGFKKTQVQVKGEQYYRDSKDLLLEVDLTDFLKNVLIRK